MAFKFLKEQLFSTMLQPPISSLAGRTVVVTGSNVGLGLSAAVHLAKLNPARLILAVRNLEKGELAKAMVNEVSQTTAQIEVWELDLASFASVQAFGKRLNGLERLDILIENAAIATFGFDKTIDGWEQT